VTYRIAVILMPLNNADHPSQSFPNAILTTVVLVRISTDSVSRGPSAIAEPLGTIYQCINAYNYTVVRPGMK